MSIKSMQGGYPESPGHGPRVRSPEAGANLVAKYDHHDAPPATPNRPTPGADGGVLRKKLYDQSLSDWTARYRKNKGNLESLARDCEGLRNDVSRQQQEVDERSDALRNLEEQFQNDFFAKHQEIKANYEMAMQQKGMLTVQISENRKHKQQVSREKKMLTADFERKHAELMRMTEVHDKLTAQLDHCTGQLGQLNRDRHRMERELDEVNHNLKAHSELADEVNTEISHVKDGIRDSMDLQGLANRVELSTSSRTGLPSVSGLDNGIGGSSLH
eukprot:TRINITY_DN54522_c0_g1_i1.p1 TRINITY_DN54522_c0_g1~~TRINITY_DN54522_c0_g1_i1.p1  ORF type:complete len:273 (+),score=59.59 TRINITY_DN54522_c0_g1_i1:120-938(+)